MANITDKKAAALGLTSKTVGKTQARKDFFPLVDSLSTANAAVQITDHDKPVAVLLSYQNYVALTAKASANVGLSLSIPKAPNLVGSVKINSDLETASKTAASRLKNAVEQSAGKL